MLSEGVLGITAVTNEINVYKSLLIEIVIIEILSPHMVTYFIM